MTVTDRFYNLFFYHYLLRSYLYCNLDLVHYRLKDKKDPLNYET